MAKYNLKKQSPKTDQEVMMVATISTSGIDNRAYEPHCNDQHENQRGLESSKARNGPRFSSESEKSTNDAMDGIRKPKLTTQVIATVVVSVAQLALGTSFGYSGVTLPELTDPNTRDIFLTTDQAATFGSIPDLGSVLCSFLTSVLFVRLGQRRSMLLALPFAAAVWIGLGFSYNVMMLQAMRFLMGIYASIMLPAGCMYILEVSHKKFRGLLFGVVTTVRQCGLLFSFSIGSLGLGWRNLAFICASVSLLPIISLYYLPNSPRWLVTQGRKEEALKSLIFYRGANYDSKLEMEEIKEEVGQNTSEHNSFRSQAKMLLEPTTLRYLVLITVLSLLCNFSGHTVLIAYVVLIFKAANITLDAYINAILVGALRVAGTMVHLCIVDRMGRKPLLVFSYLMCFLCLCVLGGYFYLQDNLIDVSHLGWVPLVSVVTFIFFSGVGQPVIFIFQGELLPTSSRGVGISIINFVAFLGGFAAIRTYPVITAVAGEHGAFWFYAGVCLAISVISYVCLPETKGRSLEEINGSLQKNDKKSDDRKSQG